MFYFSFLSADTLYFWCISNSYMTRISLTSLWSLRGQWADPANDYIWVSLYPVILYIYHYVYMCIYTYIPRTLKKKKKKVFAKHKRSPALTGTFCGDFCEINIKYFLLFLFLETSPWAKSKQSTRILPVKILSIQMLKLFWISSSVFYLYVKGQIYQYSRMFSLLMSSPVILDG